MATRKRKKTKKETAKSITELYPKLTKKQKRELEQLRSRLSKLSREELEREAELAIITKGWVPLHDPEQLHTGRKGHQAYPRESVALQPSRARTLPRLTLDEYMRKLRKAAKDPDEEALHKVVYDISHETGFDVREIYTLWFSP
jgi:hypothetical protein